MGRKIQLIFIALLVISSFEDEDVVDTDPEVDEEAAMKCDACRIVARKLAESYKESEAKVKRKLKREEEIIDASEAACDDPWEGYGTVLLEGVQRLSGPGSDVDLTKGEVLSIERNPIWSRRLQDMCDEFLVEAQDEKTLYNLWSADSNSLEAELCWGDGIFGGCSSTDWGPWLGDDYEDYEDSDYGYSHDEF